MEISLIGIVIFLIIIGAILYLIQLLPIDARIKQIIYVIIIVVVILYLLQFLVGTGPVIRLR